MSENKIEQVLAAHSDRLMNIPGVIGVAQGLSGKRPAILILAMAMTAEIKSEIPAEIDGHPVVIQHTGEIRALDAD